MNYWAAHINMPRSIITPDVQQLTDHYLRQQRGGNIAGYRGTQRGYGIGGIFRSLSRFVMPLLKKSAESVGKRVLKAATEVGQDVLDGKKSQQNHAEETFLKTWQIKEQINQIKSIYSATS